MPTYAFVLILFVVLAAILIFGLRTWLSRRPKPGRAGMDVKTQPIVGKYYSDDLQRRAFVVQRNDGMYRVVLERYSAHIVDDIGNAAGWQPTPNQPVSDSLVGAVKIARDWAHAKS